MSRIFNSAAMLSSIVPDLATFLRVRSAFRRLMVHRPF
jgi:hypothetical protein